MSTSSFLSIFLRIKKNIYENHYNCRISVIVIMMFIIVTFKTNNPVKYYLVVSQILQYYNIF